MFNSVVNKLPIELHIPGYQFCGPGTKLKKRLNRGDSGINKLDKACRAHDIAYSQSNDLTERHKADKILEEAAWTRVKAGDAGVGEKAAAWAVTNAMKIKRKIGMGSKERKKKKKINSKTVFKKVRDVLKKNSSSEIKVALSAAKDAVKTAGGRKKIKPWRVIPLAKTGGVLPLIPIFAGLSALGALAGGAAGIAKAIGTAKSAQKELEEAKRHNKTMESIAIGSGRGEGLFLKPYKRGLGLYVKQKKNL